MNDLFICVLFLFCAALALMTSGIIASIFIFGMFFIEAYYLYKFFHFVMKSAALRNRIIATVLYASGVYALLYSSITNLELWVDEIAVIKIANLPLGAIAKEAMTTHVAVPPLDYWNLWAWQHVVSLLPSSSWEFAYRMPYMVMHMVAAIIFGLLIESFVKKRWSIVVYMIAFMAYFFNPLLFIYSLEVRFYGLMLLGVVITLYVYLQHGFKRAADIPLLLLFLLNSTFQILVLFPLIGLSLWRRGNRIVVYILSGGCIVLTALIVPKLYYPQPDPAVHAVDRMNVALSMFHTIQVGALWQDVLLLGVFGFVLFLSRKRQEMRDALIVTGACFLLIEVLNLLFNYRYFGLKHYLLITPMLLLVLFSALKGIPSKLIPLFFGMVLIVCVFPWSFQTIPMIMSGNLLSKDPTGAKKLFEFARVTKKDSIYVTESPERKEDIAYRRLSLDWYAKLPPPIKIETVTSIEQICQYVYTSKTVMIYVLHGDKGCDQKFSLQTMILPSATVYY